jgi:hypothetical protein
VKPVTDATGFNLDHVLCSPMFRPLWRMAGNFRHATRWPTPGELNGLTDPQFGFVFTEIVEDGLSFEERIAEKREVQCRHESWHDFFNAMTTLAFPRMKLAVNEMQATGGGYSKGPRTTSQNMLAHVEECGVIVLSKNPKLTAYLKEFRWRELFWDEREVLNTDMRFIIYGHGLYAKALEPYIGLTGHGMIVSCDSIPESGVTEFADRHAAQLLRDGDGYRRPRDLSPIPLLGIPGWSSLSEDSSFYDNRAYFRAGRRAKEAS